MKPTRFLTWLDIQRRIQRETSSGRFFPDPIQYIHCFSDAVEIRVNNLTFNKNKAESILSEWFKDWYDKNENLIYLEPSVLKMLEDLGVLYEDRWKPSPPYRDRPQPRPETLLKNLAVMD